MSVHVRPHPRGGWDVDIRYISPTGEKRRKRVKTPSPKKHGVSDKDGNGWSRTTAREWGERHQRELSLGRVEPSKKEEVPTLNEFAPRFIDGHARANRQKPSGIAAKE